MSIITSAQENIGEAQDAYKRAFGANINPVRPVQVNDYIFVERETLILYETPDVKGTHKLATKALRPYEVISAHKDKLSMNRNGIVE